MKILIVDDSLMDRKLLSRTLTNAGIQEEILLAENGEVGLKMVAENMADLAVIFLDYQMPNMSGLDVMSALVKVPQTAAIPVFMVTASAAEESRKAAYKVNPGLKGYITKPYKPADVIEAIRPYVHTA
ncbi:MAG: response regulator [Elusimicrobia bacterium]|nr:response regulator [Elusimicrobiota bacterium]